MLFFNHLYYYYEFLCDTYAYNIFSQVGDDENTYGIQKCGKATGVVYYSLCILISKYGLGKLLFLLFASADDDHCEVKARVYNSDCKIYI